MDVATDTANRLRESAMIEISHGPERLWTSGGRLRPETRRLPSEEKEQLCSGFSEAL